MRRYLLWIVAVSTLLPGVGLAADGAGGAALFTRYCATCHGLQGRGDGPTATIISIPPTDLTRLTAENGGVFPTRRVIFRIDGRDALIAHGSPMPIYGAFFEGHAVETLMTDQGVVEASPPVIAIATYLKSVQVE